MAENFQYTLQLNTTYSGGGVAQAANDFNKFKQAVDDTAKKSQTATEKLGGFSREGQKVSASAVSMRTGIQNAAFQFQDIAVQAEMGVSGLRIFSQQVPQLLGSFGAVGAVAGAVIGIGVPLVATLFKTGDEAKDATPKIDELNQILEDHKEAVKQAAAEKRAAENRAWLDSLDEEEAYYEKINSRLERTIALQARIRAEKEKTASAERDARIAEIEADPSKSEIQKVREVAAIREEEARANIEARKKELEDQAKLAAAAAADAQSKAERQAADAAAAAQRRADAEARLVAADARKTAGIEAGNRIPELETALANTNLPISGSPANGATPEQIDAVINRRKQIQAQIDEAKKLSAQTKDAEGEGQRLNTDLPALRAGEEAQRRQAEEARKAAEEAYGKSLVADADLRLRSPQIDAQAQAERRQRAAREQAAIRQIQERETNDARREKERQQREREQSASERLRAEQGVGREAKSLIPKGASTRLRNAIEAAAQGLQDGDQGGELAKLAESVSTLADIASQSKAATEANKIAIAQVQAKIKNLRNPGTN